MYAESFEYHAPNTLQEAVGLLQQYGDDAKVLTGGMSLIPLMKLRLAAPKHVIDLRKVGDLEGVSESGGNVVIGARTTHGALETSQVLREKCPVVAQTAAQIGDVQVRNRGTIGGSLVHADPAADLPAAMLALDAQITLHGKSERTMGAGEFFQAALMSAAEPDEILTRITVPQTGKHTAYAKFAQPASGFALVGVAAVLEMDGNTCKSARIGVTGVCDTAFRATSVEQALAGQSLSGDAVRAAAEKIDGDITDPLDDPVNASADYRRHLARVFTARAVQQALSA